MTRPKIAKMVDWAFAPEWLSLSEACFLSGYDLEAMQQIIDDHGVDLDMEGRIEKRSLKDFLHAAVLVSHWDDIEWGDN